MTRFGSVCSGIEAAYVAWPFWQAAWFSEIEPFPCAVLKHHYPEVPNHGDMTTLPDRILSGEVEAPDVFCGGTPCQAFSVAGNRKSLDDARGNLSLTFCEIANVIDSARAIRGEQPCIIFWENVPGVLNTKDNAFGCFLAGLAGETVPLEPPGGKWTDAGAVSGPARTVAWRVLDAQYFGLAQRRRRVFVVASARAIDPSAILFEFQGVRRDTAPSREARQAAAADVAGGAGNGLAAYPINTLTLGGRPDPVNDARMTLGVGADGDPQFTLQAAHSHAVAVCAEISPTVTNGPPFSRTGNERVECDALVVEQMPPHAFKVRGGCEGGGKGYLGQDEQAFTILTGHDQQVAVPCLGGLHPNAAIDENLCPTLTSAMGMGGGHIPVAATQYTVRRLTPVECERLQGFPDNYTNIPWKKKPDSPDGPRYKALGNSWAVPVVNWIGKRINEAMK